MNTADQPQSDFPRLSAPARRALLAAGYTHLEQLSTATEAEILALHGMGLKALGWLKEAMAEKGISFADKA